MLFLASIDDEQRGSRQSIHYYNIKQLGIQEANFGQIRFRSDQ